MTEQELEAVPAGFERLPLGLGFTDSLQPVFRLIDEQSTSFGVFQELLGAVYKDAPALREARLRLRGALRIGGSTCVPAGKLLDRWQRTLALVWAARGVQVFIVTEDHFHVRKSLLVNPQSEIQLRCEWGLSPYPDNADNMAPFLGASLR